MCRGRSRRASQAISLCSRPSSPGEHGYGVRAGVRVRAKVGVRVKVRVRVRARARARARARVRVTFPSWRSSISLTAN
jgi:hypothetical protein